MRSLYTSINTHYKSEEHKKSKTNSKVLVREQTITTEQTPLVGEVSANFWGWRVQRGLHDGSLRPYSRFSLLEEVELLTSLHASPCYPAVGALCPNWDSLASVRCEVDRRNVRHSSVTEKIRIHLLCSIHLRVLRRYQWNRIVTFQLTSDLPVCHVQMQVSTGTSYQRCVQ
jgi:hypothetical protein